MVFFGQINLAEIKDLDKENVLPKKGILYFFSYFKDPESEYGTEYRFHMDKKEYNSLVDKGLKQAAKFSWEETARKTLEVLESVKKTK